MSPAVYSKLPNGVCQGQQAPHSPISPDIQNIDFITVETVKSKLAIMPGKVCGASVEVMLDSGSFVSIVKQEVLIQADSWTLSKPLQ